jgi:SAM-dependent methyltransferase
MYMQLDSETERLLCCPLCKCELAKSTRCFTCIACGTAFPMRTIQTSKNQTEDVYDFRIRYPEYCVPPGLSAWAESQHAFERYVKGYVSQDSYERYLSGVDAVREIYQQEFHLAGRILDVGGHQGWLRHYLGPDTGLFVSVDPYIDIFAGMDQQPNLLRAYPCLRSPCNFLAAYAEHLPFKSNVFDWIHMRSVVDHFADPFLAFLEAARCCKAGGMVLVGLAIVEKLPPAASPPKDDHLFRLTQANLKDLLGRTNWRVCKEHWVKPPYQYCLYLSAQKRGLTTEP